MSPEAVLSALDPQAQKIVAKYDQKRAATLTLLHLAQDKIGHVTPEIEAWVSKWTEVPVVHVHSVVTFYSMYHQAPVGRTHIRFCTGTSCMLMGAAEKLDCLKKKLGIENGQTTPDGRVSLEEAECLCACEGAPMMQVGDDYHLDLTEKKIDEILGKLK
ncbi:MAG TPA: NAD(P)H-dependent oxidoreductase subunit E [Candidatus Eisenbacteria bacterium]|jgi:NADH-quinone oxidoreductase subunit E|nr:NAD(P)H-dependent oxidoreductase subunit E [Candidatus Eisenbacteria bacterium]